MDQKPAGLRSRPTALASRRRGWQFTVIVVVATLALVGAAAAGWFYARVSAPPTGPMILVSIDALRADHLPAYGYQKGQAPAIDALAADGTVFERAYAHSPQTLPSHVALLSGRFPLQTGVRDDVGFAIDPDVRLLPRMLQARGWETGGFVSAYALRRELGFDRGFDLFDSQVPPAGADVPANQVSRPGSQTLAAAEKWLRTQRSPRFFLFLHLYEPHAPYEPPERYRGLAPYDGEIALADESVGQLFAYLKQRQWYDEATIVLLSPHGEGLGEHGERGHGLFLYDETIRVPLIVKLPHNLYAGRRVTAPVQHVDIVPTILDLLDAPRPSSLPGRSLRNLLESAHARLAGTAFPAEALHGRYGMGWSETYALTDERHRFIKAPRLELYDLAEDPQQRRNLVTERPVEAAAMQEALDQQLVGSASAPRREIAPPNIEKLSALGYVDLQPAAKEDADVAPVDPKDKVTVLDQVARAEQLIGRFRYGEAVALLEAVVAADPAFERAWVNLGRALERSGQRNKAVEAYRHVVTLDPWHPDGLRGVARVLLASGDTEGAAAHAEMALEMVPAQERRARLCAFVTLVEAALSTKDSDMARRWADAAEREAPGFPLAKYFEGIQLFQGEKYDEALPLFEGAIADMQAHPLGVPEFHYRAAQALHRLGREPEARVNLEEALRLAPADLASRAALVTVLASEGRTAEAAAAIDDLVRAVPTYEGYAAAIRLATTAGDKTRAAALRAARPAPDRRPPAPPRPER